MRIETKFHVGGERRESGRWGQRWDGRKKGRNVGEG